MRCYAPSQPLRRTDPEIVEMDLNPLFVFEKGAVAADVRVRLAQDR